MKKVVVLMSAYNGERFLKKQLDSICRQQIGAEILLYVRDDCSKDHTLNILEEFSNKIKMVFDESSGKQKMGPAESFWHLFLTAPDADYYCFSDQDDVWDDDKIAKAILQIGDKTETPILYCCNSRVIDSHDKIIQEKSLISTPRLNIVSQLISGEIPGCAMVLNSKLRKEILQKKIHCIPMHDWVIILNALIIGNVIFDDRAHFSRRVHGNNVVANAGKNKLNCIIQSMHNWMNNKGKVCKVAQDLLTNYEGSLSEDVKEYLKWLSNYRFNIFCIIKILSSRKTSTNNKNALRSFKARIILGLI